MAFASFTTCDEHCSVERVLPCKVNDLALNEIAECAGKKCDKDHEAGVIGVTAMASFICI